MDLPRRPIAYVLAAANHGTMIVNRHDYRMVDQNRGYGVGYQILNNACFDPSEVGFVLRLLACRRRHFGDGVVAIDAGANIGVHTIEWARHMHGWGRVLSFEAQEVVFYALAGNIALNNCLNARARLAALGETCGELQIPQPDYFTPASFGSLELRQRQGTEFIGQAVSYEAQASVTVPMVTFDSLGLDRLDLVKIDVEGMELDVLRGGRALLERTRPLMMVEVIKSDRVALESFVTGLGYKVFQLGMNMLAIHADDPTLQQVQLQGNVLSLLP